MNVHAFTTLEEFYRRAMSAYIPQGEDLLYRVRTDDLSLLSFRYTFSVEAMAHISHILEDAAAAQRGEADLHVSFQRLSRLLPQMPRYRHLAGSLHGLWIYGSWDVPDVDAFRLNKRTTLINTEGTPLEAYWFVIVHGPGIGMCLLAREVPSLIHHGRYYEGFYTFERSVALEAIGILHRIFPEQVPDPTDRERK